MEPPLPEASGSGMAAPYGDRGGVVGQVCSTNPKTERDLTHAPLLIPLYRVVSPSRVHWGFTPYSPRVWGPSEVWNMRVKFPQYPSVTYAYFPEEGITSIPRRLRGNLTQPVEVSMTLGDLFTLGNTLKGIDGAWEGSLESQMFPHGR